MRQWVDRVFKGEWGLFSLSSLGFMIIPSILISTKLTVIIVLLFTVNTGWMLWKIADEGVRGLVLMLMSVALVFVGMSLWPLWGM